MAVAMARSAGPPPARGAAAAARGPCPACAARSAAQRATISFILGAAARAERGGPGAGLSQSPRLPAHHGTWSLGVLGCARGRPCPDYTSQGASGGPRAHWLLGIQGGAPCPPDTLLPGASSPSASGCCVPRWGSPFSRPRGRGSRCLGIFPDPGVLSGVCRVLGSEPAYLRARRGSFHDQSVDCNVVTCRMSLFTC